LRLFNLFGESDVEELQRLTQIVGGEVYRKTPQALTGLRWILGLVERVKATSVSLGYVPSPGEEENYATTIPVVMDALSAIVEICDPNNLLAPK
jgi:hypothetical protein